MTSEVMRNGNEQHFENLLFSKKGTPSKRAAVRTPWTPTPQIRPCTEADAVYSSVQNIRCHWRSQISNDRTRRNAGRQARVVQLQKQSFHYSSLQWLRMIRRLNVFFRYGKNAKEARINWLTKATLFLLKWFKVNNVRSSEDGSIGDYFSKRKTM